MTILFILIVLLVLLVLLVLPVRFQTLSTFSKINQIHMKIIQHLLESMKFIKIYQIYLKSHKFIIKSIKINANPSKSIQITRTCMILSSATARATAVHCYIYSVCSFHMFDPVIYILGH